MKSKMVAVLLTMAMTITVFTGCGNSESSTTETGGNETSVAEGEVPASTGKTEFANDKLVGIDPAILEGFAEGVKTNTGIEITISAAPDTAAYQTTIQQSIHDPSAPGLFTWWSGPQLESLVKNDLVEDLTAVWESDILGYGVSEDIAEAFTIDGKIYAAPYSILYNTTLYNKDIFTKLNLQVPTTFDEFLTVCEKIKAAGITPISFKNDAWAGFIWFQQLLAAKDPQLYIDVCNGTKKYTDPEVKEVMEIWEDMIDKGYFSTPMTVSDVKKQMASGEIAMMLEPNTEIKSLVSDFGMVSGQDLGTFVVPPMDGGKSVIFFEAAPICVAKNSADKGSAMEALKKWYVPEFQTFIVDNLGIANTNQVQIEDPTFEEVVAFTSDSESYQMLLRYYENTPEEIRNVALDELMKFELGNGEIDDVLNTIQEKADEVWASME